VEKFWQYSFRAPSNAPLPIEKEDLIYGKMNYNSELEPYGWSPLMSIQQEVELMIQSTRWNKEMYRNNTIPAGLVQVQMDEDNLKKLKSTWETEIAGKAHKLLFLDSQDLKFTDLSRSGKDMEWLEGQKWYFHTIFGAYGLSPQEVGYYDNSSRATGDSQERITIKNAIKPYLKHIADKINREIIPELLGHDEVKFQWFPTDHVEEKVEHEQTMAKLAANVLTINEVRAKDGLDDVEWGDVPMFMAMQPGEEDSSASDEVDETENRDDRKEDAEETKKLYQKLFKGFLNGEQ